MSHAALHELLQTNAMFLNAFIAASIVFAGIVLIVERLSTRIAAAQRHRIVTLAMLAPSVLFIAGLLRFDPPADTPAVTGEVTMVATSFRVEEPARNEWLCALAMLWLAGVAISILKSLLELRRWRGIIARAEDRGMFALSDEICEPLVAGLLSQKIVLPARGYIENLSFEELETVFAHEEEHIARRDNLVAFATQLVTSLFWFDPIHRLARRRAVELRERACDEAVLARGCDPEPYVAALAKSCRGALHLPAVACMSRIGFRERMESIMNFERNRLLPLPSWSVRMLFFSVLVAAAASFAVFAPPTSFALEETDGKYDVAAVVRKTPEGKYSVVVTVKTPDGTFTNAMEFGQAPEQREVKNIVGARVYKTVVVLGANGTGSAVLEVLDGPTTVATVSRTFDNAYVPPPPPPGYKRVGGDVKAPVVLSRVEPVYPDEAKVQRIAGIVILQILISDTGDVADVTVLKPLPYGLDKAAVDAVKQWKFAPATQDGAPVPVVFNITINFKLNE
jgi:TonB family protein